MNLIERCQRMFDELGVPVTSFCRKMNISPSYFYACKRGTMSFSKAVEKESMII